MRTFLFLLATILATSSVSFAEARPSATSAEAADIVIVTKEGDAFRATINYEVPNLYFNVSLQGGPDCIIYYENIARIEKAGDIRVKSENPIVRIPSIVNIYSFQGRYFDKGNGGKGYLSVVDAVVASGHVDDQLREYVKDYRAKVLTGSINYWVGRIMSVGGIAYSLLSIVTHTHREGSKSVTDSQGLLQSGVGYIICFAGMSLWFGGQDFAGPPTAIVNYYNETHRTRQPED